MNDAAMATIARQLAHALAAWGRSRAPDDLRVIAQLHTDLCRQARLEDEQAKADEAAS